MTDARTELSLREFVQGCFDRESDSLAESTNRDITSGAMVAYQNVLAEIDRREAVPTVTTLDGLLQHLDQNEDYFAMDINKRYHDDGTECVITLARPTQREISHTGKSFAESIAAVESAAKGGG